MRRLRAVMVKELRQIGRDPLSLLMIVVFPAAMLILYGFALNFDVRHVRLAHPLRIEVDGRQGAGAIRWK